MNPETWIPFTVGEQPCTDMSKRYVVTLRIFNGIRQPISVPLVQANGDKLNKLRLQCGSYRAYWNGKYDSNGRQAASGVYVYELEVDGQKFTGKMTVAK
jgi:hypothetical protein